tara:strand:- start:9028 stop:10239 length:1212 start_codon:yes stop_codon:yes gene_type:complete
VLINKEDPRRYKEKILVNHFNVKKSKNLKLLWFHAASIGELKSIIPIIKKINDERKNYEFLVTTITLSSSQFAETKFKNFKDIEHRFMPFDVDHIIEKFLNKWKPEKIFLVDSEIWPNLILKAKKHNIPIALINARLTKKSLNRWLLFPKTAQRIFTVFDLCLCSNKETQNFLQGLNAKNIKYEGNIKFINEQEKKIHDDRNTQLLLNSRFWIAASIHKEEDILCLKTHIEIKKKYNDIITILAPRHVDRVNKIKNLSEKLNLNTQILNKNDEILKDSEIIIINSYGVLQNYFLHAKSVFIGKSLIKRLKNDSGQNPIDAAYLNCKIYHGPYVSNFQEIYEMLKNRNISFKIESHSELSENLIFDLNKIQKQNQFSKNIESLGKKIFTNTMSNIEIFLNEKSN